MTTHPLQSNKWAQFRKKTGVKVIESNGYILTIHPIPYTKFNIGYFPKGPGIDEKMLAVLRQIAEDLNCIFIQIEPDVEAEKTKKYNFKNLLPSARPLFTKYNFILDLTKSEEELLKEMSQKTRYNIRLSEKKGVKVSEDNTDGAFDKYLELTQQTTKRQNFYAHTKNYHKMMWETLRQEDGKTINTNELSAHLLKATYKGQILVTWVLFILGDTLYYPYGASSIEYREVMASNLVMWEAVKFGKKLGLKKFDLWGALGPDPDPKDPWYGFHRFKQGYGPKLVEYVGSYDFVIKPLLYLAYKALNQIRWLLLRLR